MKKAYIIGILMIVFGIGYLITASGDVSSYANFDDAKPDSTVKIAGNLVKSKPIVFDPNTNANYFSFFMEDKEGKTMQVVNYGAKPQDFEMSESIVITGQLEEDKFIASDILLKCPSKYKDQEVLLRKNG